MQSPVWSGLVWSISATKSLNKLEGNYLDQNEGTRLTQTKTNLKPETRLFARNRNPHPELKLICHCKGDSTAAELSLTRPLPKQKQSSNKNPSYCEQPASKALLGGSGARKRNASVLKLCLINITRLSTFMASTHREVGEKARGCKKGKLFQSKKIQRGRRVSFEVSNTVLQKLYFNMQLKWFYMNKFWWSILIQ